MNKFLVIALSLVSSLALGAPFVASDANLDTIQPTICGVYINNLAKVEAPVVKDAAGKSYCRVDVGTLAAGSHTVRVTHIVKDPIWGTMESAQSAPFVFSRPAIPTTPVGLELTP